MTAAERNRLWRLQNRERDRENHRAWAEKNRETQREKNRIRMAAWRERNPDKVWKPSREGNAIRGLLYRERYPEKRKATVRAYQVKDQERRRVREANRRARIKGAGGSGVSLEEWTALCELFGGRCAYCGAVGKLTLDHVDPIARGGWHDMSNVVPACLQCNVSKNAKPLLLWFRWNLLKVRVAS